MYLAEELIRFDDGPDGISGGGSKKFTKFIHNSNPNPFPEPGEYGYETAEFLAFTQHVQYSNTNGQVYISDYQGSTTLLSDPQILTHPDVNQGQILFGEGNLEDEVAAFEHQHVCNKYCKWPGFQLEVFGKGKARSSGTASKGSLARSSLQFDMAVPSTNVEYMWAVIGGPVTGIYRDSDCPRMECGRASPPLPIAIQCISEREAQLVCRTLQPIVNALPANPSPTQLLAALGDSRNVRNLLHDDEGFHAVVIGAPPGVHRTR
ncbi:hypothetical protein M404DRAFT_26113 [Pisolithus tinctorius Marx 270]|uniref:Alpha-type protein kinase domain-containing protein n=1 Tax=Pisolithus tinctorius Marx 270 TaxID=870435 RepID=A0A0C3J6I5_PISTI|nr:hypothetical protein M404DRAFT_26113 [Pisolithus tinctorius Marx 270]